MAAVLLALAASASWGISDFLGGLKARALDVVAVLAISQPAGLVLLGAIVGVRGGWPGWGWWVLWAVLGGLGGATGRVALYRGERPSSIQLAGIALALVGGAVAGWEPGEAGARGRAAVGAGLALLA